MYTQTIYIYIYGLRVGKATLTEITGSDEIMVSDVKINFFFRGKRLASDLIEKINSLLDESKKKGSLVNVIKNSKKRNLYQEHGWYSPKSDQLMKRIPKRKI